MNTVDVDEVIIKPNRIRRSFDDQEISDLADSIERNGLINPITLEGDCLTLIAGERRLRAVKLLKETSRADPTCSIPGQIPYTTKEGLSSLALLEVELEENLLRTDLSWQEQVKARADLHNLRGTQADIEGAEWTVTQTASEILGKKAKGSQITEMSEDIALAEFLDDPMVSEAKSRKEAIRAIRELKAQVFRADSAAAFDSIESPHTLIHGSCYDVMPTLAAESFDCILVDPPYGIEVTKHDFTTSRHKYDDSKEALDLVIDFFFEAAFRVAKPQAHLYVFCDVRKFNNLFIAAELAGWDVWARPFIWDKGNVGTFGNADMGPRHVYDAILYANKGSRPCIAMYRDIITIAPSPDAEHAATKPVELYIDLLKRTINPGDKVADFFGGSGTIIAAAEELKCQATYVEVEEKFYQLAIERHMMSKGA